MSVIAELAKLNNFNGMAAFYSGIVHSSTSKKTIQSLSPFYRQIYENAEQLFSEKSNYKRYREVLRSAGLTCIPYVGLFFRDLKQLLKGEFMERCQISLERCVEVANLVGDFTKYQRPHSQIDFSGRDIPLENQQIIPCVQKWIWSLVDEKGTSVSSEQFDCILHSLVSRFVVKVKEGDQMPLWMKVRTLF
jgi:hypothetical protein